MNVQCTINRRQHNNKLYIDLYIESVCVHIFFIYNKKNYSFFKMFLLRMKNEINMSGVGRRKIAAVEITIYSNFVFDI